MLVIKTTPIETWDEESEKFGKTKSITFRLEHSLLSLSKWESKHKKPFLTNGNKTNAEMFDYIKCMDLDKHNDSDYLLITNKELEDIGNYISDKQTATWFKEKQKEGGKREIITSEIIYYWIFEYGIDVSCEKWHLNRLLTLIRVFSEKNKESIEKNRNKNRKPTKQSLDERRALMESRRKQFGQKV